jgi:predicted nucleic acid-binding protein
VADAVEEVDPMLLSELDHGEAAVIHIARQRRISNVLIDERKGRRVAELVYGLSVKGSAAILLEAKRRGLLASVKLAIESMQAGGYFLGPKLVAECLRQAGE